MGLTFTQVTHVLMVSGYGILAVGQIGQSEIGEKVATQNRSYAPVYQVTEKKNQVRLLLR